MDKKNVDYYYPQEQVEKIVGFTASAWDLFHTGHVLFLKESKKVCDHLIVGLHVNPSIERDSKNKPIQSVYERYTQLEGCKYVDEIIVYETESDLINILKTRNISVRFLGSDYAGKEHLITAATLVPIHYISRNHSFSSSELRKRIVENDTDSRPTRKDLWS